MNKRLYRSNKEKMLGGVCGGLGQFFDVDPTIVRVIAVILGLASGGGAIIAYIIGWVIIPEELPSHFKAKAGETSQKTDPPRVYTSSSTWTRYFPGMALIFFGALILVREHWFWISFDEIWPLLIIGIGLALIFWKASPNQTAQSVETETETETSRNDGHNESTVS